MNEPITQEHDDTKQLAVYGITFVASGLWILEYQVVFNQMIFSPTIVPAFISSPVYDNRL